MSTTPFPYLPSGQSFVSEVSGASFLGSVDKPFGTIYALAISGVTLGAGNISTINSSTGPAITIVGISGIGVTTAGTTITVSGTAGGATFTGGAITSSLTPTVSSTLSVGTTVLPFSGVTSLNYDTIVPTLTHVGTTQAINFSSGTSQKFTFLNGQPSGVTFTLSGGVTGSSYALETVNNASGTGFITWASNTTLWNNGISGNTTLTADMTDLFTFYYNGSKYIGGALNNVF